MRNIAPIVTICIGASLALHSSEVVDWLPRARPRSHHRRALARPTTLTNTLILSCGPSSLKAGVVPPAERFFGEDVPVDPPSVLCLLYIVAGVVLYVSNDIRFSATGMACAWRSATAVERRVHSRWDGAR